MLDSQHSIKAQLDIQCLPRLQRLCYTYTERSLFWNLRTRGSQTFLVKGNKIIKMSWAICYHDYSALTLVSHRSVNEYISPNIYIFLFLNSMLFFQQVMQMRCRPLISKFRPGIDKSYLKAKSDSLPVFSASSLRMLLEF